MYEVFHPQFTYGIFHIVHSHRLPPYLPNFVPRAPFFTEKQQGGIRAGELNWFEIQKL